MMHLPEPIVKDLVLLGGGHSHAIALKQLGMNPLRGVRLTLITDVYHTPYSGMLPGYIAGFYSFDECHIDLQPLSQFAQAQMVVDRAVGLDLENQRVLCANHPPIGFDLLSLDIGSTPATLTVPGATEHAIPVKPIAQFLSYWDQLVAEISQNPQQPLTLAVVGGGTGGVELALALQAHLTQILAAADLPGSHLQIHLLHRGDRLLPERNRWVGDRLAQILRQRGVHLHLEQTVTAIESVNGQKQICCESGFVLPCDRIFWVTQAAAAPWLKASGLQTDDRGFIQVNDKLQSLSHPQIFAAGDVATMLNHPRPKAGVFAVRQGKPLYENLRRSLLGQPLKPFIPQKEFLILVGTGDRRAVASRGCLGGGAYGWLWRWKDAIDRKFIDRFQNLQPMTHAQPPLFQGLRAQILKPQSIEIAPEQAKPVMHCAGCGSKVGSSVLQRALDRVRSHQPWAQRTDVLLGLDSPDDAAVVSVPAGRVMVQTIDHFRTLVPDPYVFGQICANHCLSDLFAMAAEPQTALALATLPYGTDAKLEETLYQVLAGAVAVLNQAGAVLIGGHTTEGAELSFGLTCNGLAEPERLWHKGSMQPGQVLILTKALGTGTLFAADMQLKAKGRWIAGAIDSMLQSNQAAVACLKQQGATACTDITGFGLAGHLLEMVRAAGLAVSIDLNALPILEGAKETAQQGWLSSLHRQNLTAERSIHAEPLLRESPLYALLFDPQTSGGLLAAVAPERSGDCLSRLRAAGYIHSRVIGSVLDDPEPKIVLRQ